MNQIKPHFTFSLFRCCFDVTCMLVQATATGLAQRVVQDYLFLDCMLCGYPWEESYKSIGNSDAKAEISFRIQWQPLPFPWTLGP